MYGKGAEDQSNEDNRYIPIYQLGHDVPYQEPTIYGYGNKLIVVKTFVCLCSTLSKTCTRDDKVCLRISKASDAFGEIQKRFSSRCRSS